MSIGFLQPDDMEVVFVEPKEGEENIYLEILEVVSPEEQKVAMIGLDEIGIGENIVMITTETPSGDYNLSMRFFPVFGTVAFAQAHMVEIGNFTLVSLSANNKEILQEYVTSKKLEEIETGVRDDITKQVEKVGIDKFLRDINEEFLEGESELEKQYEELKPEQGLEILTEDTYLLAKAGNLVLKDGTYLAKVNSYYVYLRVKDGEVEEKEVFHTVADLYQYHKGLIDIEEDEYIIYHNRMEAERSESDETLMSGIMYTSYKDFLRKVYPEVAIEKGYLEE